MQRFLPWVVLLASAMASGGAHAQSLLDACHATSSYDVTISDNGVTFDRAQPEPRRVHLNDGRLGINGKPVNLDAEDSDRVTLIERTVRTLEPKVKAIADRGVDLAAQAVREQAAASASGESGELDARLASVSADLKARIAASHSSHDWHGPAFQQYANQTVARIVPLLASGLLQQAVTAALSGDLDAAAQLRQRATHMATALRTRIRQKLQVLRPQVQALCPSLRRMDQLESGIHTPLPGGVHINLIDVGKRQTRS
ncbi:MAG TPA: DUF2884 family protein [Rhodanobacteraceae bacterium]|nr:DUF2884 family protein [Rhodanobacteraceae bacterium]